MQELFTARKYTFLHLFEHLGGAKVGTDRQKLHTDSHRRAKYIDRQAQTVIDWQKQAKTQIFGGCNSCPLNQAFVTAPSPKDYERL